MSTEKIAPPGSFLTLQRLPAIAEANPDGAASFATSAAITVDTKHSSIDFRLGDRLLFVAVLAGGGGEYSIKTTSKGLNNYQSDWPLARGQHSPFRSLFANMAASLQVGRAYAETGDTS